jgi:hypothetical protein
MVSVAEGNRWECLVVAWCDAAILARRSTLPSERSGWHHSDGQYIRALMCGRVIQSSGPLRYAIVDRINVCDSRVHNDPQL